MSKVCYGCIGKGCWMCSQTGLMDNWETDSIKEYVAETMRKGCDGYIGDDYCSGGGCFEGCKHSPTGKQYFEGYNEALKRAVEICEGMIVVGRLRTAEQELTAECLLEAAKEIRKLNR